MAVHVKNPNGGCDPGYAWHGCDTGGTCVRIDYCYVLVPTWHVFESNDTLVIHVALPNAIFCLAGPSSAPGAVPRHPPTPYGFVGMHVFYPFDFDHAVIDEAIEGCKLFSGINTPPEPLSASFMQGAKDSRYTFFLQFKEVIGDVVNVGYDSFVRSTFGIPFSGAWLETCREIEIGVLFPSCKSA